jgi:hypothetical protein
MRPTNRAAEAGAAYAAVAGLTFACCSVLRVYRLMNLLQSSASLRDAPMQCLGAVLTSLLALARVLMGSIIANSY